MADITNPEAVKFTNERIRVAADAFGVAYNTAKALVAEWTANNMGTLLPVSADVVVDGSASDGRHVITGNDCNGIIARANELIADYEASGNAKLYTVLGVAVNYQSRF